MQAIILKRSNFREYDQLISAYTLEKGKLEALARGVKKSTSKNTAHVEPFSMVHIEVVPGKRIDYLIKVVPIQYFRSIRSDVQKSLYAQKAISFLDIFVRPGVEDRQIFALIQSFLIFLNTNTDASPVLLDGFVMQLFAHLGFAPELQKCVICSRNFHDVMKQTLEHTHKKAGLYFAGGGLVCSDCAHVKRSVGEEVLVCGLKEISDLQFIIQADWRTMVSAALSEEDKKKLHQLVYAYVLYHTERRVVDWKQVELPSYASTA